MFRLTGWRLAAIASSPLFRQKGKISTTAAEPPTAQPATRRVGTVKSFMHRRGYGFLLEAEGSHAALRARDSGAVATSSSGAPATFFFPRSSLDGGFYLTEGQTVSFDVRLVEPSSKLGARLAEANTEASQSPSSPSSRADVDDVASGAPSKLLSVAHRIRLYDVASGKERPVTPIVLLGYVENWDSLAGTGVIAELDLSGSLHDDAPRFTVSLEDLDLSGRSELRRGRYVRFCLEPGDRTAARRVIIDRTAEKRHAVKCPDGTADDDAAADERRFYGTVREVVESRFGFIVLNDSGESIFFHLSSVEGEPVKAGDIVSFALREVALGKHAGKRKCTRVQKCTTRPSAMSALREKTAGKNNKKDGKNAKARREMEDEDEFELLD